MRTEFQIVLAHGGGSKQDLERIRNCLKDTARNDCDAILRHIDEDFTAARLIQEAQKMPATSEAHRLAEAFLSDFREQHEAHTKESEAIFAEMLKGVE